MRETTIPGKVASIVAPLLQRAYLALDSDTSVARLEIQRALELLLATATPAEPQAHLVHGPTRGLAPWQARKVIDHVHAHLEAPIRVEDMAGVTRLSTSHFFRAFRVSFSMPPHAYVRAVRLARARELLLGSDEPVSRIAVTCGFADQAHFSRVFRHETGSAPALWRRERRSPLAAKGPMAAERALLTQHPTAANL